AVVVLYEFLSIAAVVFGSPSLKELTSSQVPMTYFIQSVGGTTLDDLISIGVILALVNSAIVGALGVGRVVYSSGSDRAGPGPLNVWLGSIHPRTQTPVIATGLMGGLGVLLLLFVDLATAVEITTTLLVFMYALVAAAAIVSRISQRDHVRPYRMPLWP